MKGLLNPTANQLNEAALDISCPAHGVQVEIRNDAKVLWVSVDGITVLRICQIPTLELNLGGVVDATIQMGDGPKREATDVSLVFGVASAESSLVEADPNCTICEGSGEVHDADFSDGDSDKQMFLKQDTLRPCSCRKSDLRLPNS